MRATITSLKKHRCAVDFYRNHSKSSSVKENQESLLTEESCPPNNRADVRCEEAAELQILLTQSQICIFIHEVNQLLVRGSAPGPPGPICPLITLSQMARHNEVIVFLLHPAGASVSL